MNLKLKRLVRTPNSEQYALFDLDQVDENADPQAIGKLDLHYTGEGTYGTVLLWDEVSRQMEAVRRQAFLRALLNEIAQPMGVPSEYVVEYFAPALADYEMLHNITLDDGMDDGLDDGLDDIPDDDLYDEPRTREGNGSDASRSDDQQHQRTDA